MKNLIILATLMLVGSNAYAYGAIICNYKNKNLQDRQIHITRIESGRFIVVLADEEEHIYTKQILVDVEIKSGVIGWVTSDVSERDYEIDISRVSGKLQISVELANRAEAENFDAPKQDLKNCESYTNE